MGVGIKVRFCFYGVFIGGFLVGYFNIVGFKDGICIYKNILYK